MMKKLLVVLCLFMVGSGAFSKGMIQAKGSDTILNVTQAIAEEFMKENKGARIAVTGGGSGAGIAALINGTTDIAMASRDIKDSEVKKIEETGKKLSEVTLAYDGITVIINEKNGTTDLDSKTLGKIYRGEITNWKEVGGQDADIVVFSRDSSSGTHIFFKEHILREGNAKGPEEYGDKTLYAISNEAIKQGVVSNVNAIGYIGMGYMDDSVKAISVDGVSPSIENVKNKSYPINRAVYWYVTDKLSDTGKELVKFMEGSKGQALVVKEGFVPAH